MGNVRIKITETFTKEVEVMVPKILLRDERLVVRWVRIHGDNRIFDATSMFGVNDAGDMDYKNTVTVSKL